MGVRELREPRAVLLARKNGQDPSEITTRSQFDLSRDLQYEYKSSSLCCVEDLVKSLDTGEPPRKSAHYHRWRLGCILLKMSDIGQGAGGTRRSHARTWS